MGGEGADWGEFLFRFELGPLSFNFPNSAFQVKTVRRGARAFFSTGVQGPLTWLFSLFCLLERRGLLEAILLCQQLSSMHDVSFDANAS